MSFKPDVVKMLLEAGAGGKDFISHTLDSFIATAGAPCTDEQMNDKVAVLSTLLDAATETMSALEQGVLMKALCRSVLMHDAVVLKAMSQRYPTLVDVADRTHLSHAVHTRDAVLARVLIDAGADATALDKNNRPLLYSLFDPQLDRKGPKYHEKREILHMLLDAGADPTVCFGADTDDGEDVSILRWISRGHVEQERVIPEYVASAFIGDILNHIAARPVAVNMSDVAAVGDTSGSDMTDSDGDLKPSQKRPRRTE
jgi:hypothetical protein